MLPQDSSLVIFCHWYLSDIHKSDKPYRILISSYCEHPFYVWYRYFFILLVGQLAAIGCYFRGMYC
jgi:hypothetical protein